MQKRMRGRVLALGSVLAWGAVAGWAGIVGGVNWADAAVDYGANVQNYGGTLMTPATEWWVTGPADADVNGNGAAWDAEDQDTVAGWRGGNPHEFLTVQWDTPIPDLAGADLSIALYRGPGAAADVLASVDGSTFELIGTIGGGVVGEIVEATFDFGGLLASDVQYVKVVRTASGPQTGMFFDAFGGNVP